MFCFSSTQDVLWIPARVARKTGLMKRLMVKPEKGPQWQPCCRTISGRREVMDERSLPCANPAAGTHWSPGSNPSGRRWPHWKLASSHGMGLLGVRFSYMGHRITPRWPPSVSPHFGKRQSSPQLRIKQSSRHPPQEEGKGRVVMDTSHWLSRTSCLLQGWATWEEGGEKARLYSILQSLNSLLLVQINNPGKNGSVSWPLDIWNYDLKLTFGGLQVSRIKTRKKGNHITEVLRSTGFWSWALNLPL